MINPFSMLQGMVNGQSPAAQFMQSMQGSNIENAMKQAQQMMQGNPSLWGRVQQMMQGKNPAQLKRVAEKLNAAERNASELRIIAAMKPQAPVPAYAVANPYTGGSYVA